MDNVSRGSDNLSMRTNSPVLHEVYLLWLAGSTLQNK